MLSWAKISGKALRLWAEAARKYPRLRDESAVVSATLPPASFTDPPEGRLGALAPAAHVQARGPPSGRCACQKDPSGWVISLQPSGTADRSRSSGRANPDTHGATTMAQSYPTDYPRDRPPSSEQPRPRRRSNHGDDRIRRRHRRDADRLSDRRWL